MPDSQFVVSEDEAINLDGGTIEVTVMSPKGSRTTFIVHEDLARSASEYIDQGIDKLADDEKREITVFNTEPDIFRLYLHWLYRGTLPCESVQRTDPDAAGNSEFLQLAKAYKLSSRLDDCMFKDVVLQSSMQKASPNQAGNCLWLPSPSLVGYMYTEVSERSELRDIFLDYCVAYATEDMLGLHCHDDFPQEFLFDLSCQLLRGRMRR